MMKLDRRRFLQSGAAVGLTAALAAPATAALARSGRGPTSAEWERLRRSVGGDLVLPEDADYARAVQLQVAEYDRIRPKAVLYCSDEKDVRTALRFSQDQGISGIPRSGGHSNAGYSTGEGLVIDVSRLNSVDVGRESARIGAGTQSVDALPVLSSHGVALANGTCPTVAAAGFVTGGGTGPLSRRYGVASDQLRSARVVLADGRILTCDRDRHPDLFWALRGGGGGNFGVITEYTLDHVPARNMGRFRLLWHWDHVVDVALGLQEWMRDLPEEIAADLLVVLPDAAPGQVPLVQVIGTSLGTLEDLEGEAARLAALIGEDPTESTVVDGSYRDTMMAVWGCSDKTTEECHRVGFNPEGLLPRDAFRLTRGRLVSEPISESGVTDLVEAFEAHRAPGQIRIMSWRVMGGRINGVGAADTAFVHRDAAFNVSLTFGLNATDGDQGEKDTVLAALHDGFAVLDPLSNGHSLQNFTDPHLSDWRQAYYGDNHARLARVARRYDPDRFFRLEQSI